MRVMVVAMMDMRQHTFNSVRERSGAVNEEKQPSQPIFSMRRIRILHAPPRMPHPVLIRFRPTEKRSETQPAQVALGGWIFAKQVVPVP